MTTECRRLTDYGHVFAGIDRWNRTHPEFSIPERLVSQNVFAPFDGMDVTAWGGFENDELVAFVLGKRLTEAVPDFADGTVGWISLFADDSDDDTHLASELLATVERDMAARGVTRLRFGGDPGQFLPGVPTEFDTLRESLREAGFSPDGTYFDLKGDLATYESPPRIADVGSAWPNLTLERVGANTEPLFAFLSEQFPGRWLYEARNFARVPGGADDYWLLRNDGKAVGFGRTNTPESGYRGGNVNWVDRFDGRVCGLGPLGIDEAYRGHGWGLWLVATLAERYRDAGYDHMIIDWTDLVGYYAKLGFEPWVAYESFTKELDRETAR
ncbi:GNAT family N-acetyltransferase [Haladaptatus sp. R4]|uniref:GNAT family N-acetyltransferase n=1 Tax=Haladaptatus sp. R4 TaxID=1679489 RepID=UPI0008265054|nr:GNAT family N-acetyltransferase [Haladaptatus sp. R4]